MKRVVLHKSTAETSCGLQLTSNRGDAIVFVTGVSGLAAAGGVLPQMQLHKVDGQPVSTPAAAASLLKLAVGPVTLELASPPVGVAHAAKLRCTWQLALIATLVGSNYVLLLVVASWRSLALCHALIGLFGWALARTLRTHPGLVPIGWSCAEADQHFFCPRSGRHLPLRSKYVVRTGEAYLLLDHYCNWLATPIGLRNRRFFLLFLSYGTALCLYGVVSMAALLLASHTPASAPHAIASTSGLAMLGETATAARRAVWLLGVCDMLAFLVLGWFALNHWVLAVRNHTTVEWKEGRATFDLDSMRLNLEVVFGRPSWAWVLPVRSGGPQQVDGFSWTPAGEKASDKAL